MSTTDEHDLLFLVTGTGNTCCTAAEHLEDVPAETLDWYVSKEKRTDHPGLIGGFSSLTASSQGVRVLFYDQDGQELYATKSMPPREQRGQK